MPSNIGATEHHQFYGHDASGSSLSTLATDQAGNANFTVGTNCIYSSSFGYGEPCTTMVSCVIRFSMNPAGYIFSRYSGTTRQGIRYNGSTGLQLVVNNAIAHTLTVPASGTYSIAIHWSMSDDPVNTGSVRSEVRVWDSTADALIDGISWTHAAPSLSGSDIIFGAQVSAGTNSAQVNLTGAGYLMHEIGSIQTHRDRVTAAAAPSLVGDAAIDSCVPDYASNFGDQTTPAGPTHALAAQAVNANRLILGSPLVNLQWIDPDPVVWGEIAPLTWHADDPVDGATVMSMGWLWRRPVPGVFNYAHCRLYVVSENASPTEENDVTLRVWSCNRNPLANSAVPLAANYTEVVLDDINDTLSSGDGAWVDFSDLLKISRTEDGDETWLAISIDVNGATEDTQNTFIRSVVIEPMSVESEDADAEEGGG